MTETNVADASETMRRVNALADLLARKCPLRELLAAIRETEGIVDTAREPLTLEPTQTKAFVGWLNEQGVPVTDCQKGPAWRTRG